MTNAPLTQPGNERLELLYQLAQTFNSSLDLEEVLNRVMDEVIGIMHAERGFVVLLEPNGTLGFKVARGIEQKVIDDPQFQVSRSIVEKVVQEGQAILTSDAQEDNRFNMRQSVLAMGLRAILCVPLRIKQKKMGAIYVDNRLRAGIFTPADLALLSAIASSAAIAIENARLYQVAVEQGRMEREMQMARKVQTGLLPRSIPTLPGWEFAAHWVPAREVGGDYYDFIPLPGDGLGLVIADVTDKGMPAALFMASTRAIIRACMESGSAPAAGIQHASRLLASKDEEPLYVSLVYAVVQPGGNILRYVNAGHNSPLLVRRQSGDITELKGEGIWLGVDPSRPYLQQNVTLESGDFVFLYTDGVTDATNPKNEDFGLDRLCGIISEHRNENVESIKNAVVDGVTKYIKEAVPFDDITCLLIKKS